MTARSKWAGWSTPIAAVAAAGAVEFRVMKYDAPSFDRERILILVLILVPHGFLLLVVRPGALSLLLVVRPGAPSLVASLLLTLQVSTENVLIDMRT